ncbi:TPA: hypothetical protein ACSPNY_001714 [Pseudomonas aeruginosa]
MSKVQRFWCDEARNIRCVREDDFDALEAEAQALREEVEALRARGLTVSEGLLRRIAAPVNNQDELDAVHEARIELRALLNQDKENGDHAA